MKKSVAYILYALLRWVLSLRYKITVKGLGNITPKNLKKKGGILFLANHPAEIDPPILFRVLWPKFSPHPIALESLFHKKFVGSLLRYVRALPVPNFEDSSNSYKRKNIEKTYAAIFSIIDRKENLLLYPAGCLKHQSKEILGGASGVHEILSKCKHANVVLISTKGLWGSSFSRALTHRSPELGPTFWHGFKTLLKNGLFFTPRRRVEVSLEVASDDFPYEGDRREINHYLEQWYNKEGEEPLSLVSYSFWKQDLPKIAAKKTKESGVAIGNIPQEIQHGVKEELARLTEKKVSEIEPSHHLAQDLGLDSLDLAQLVIFLKDEYGVQELRSYDLTTVESVMAFAAHLKRAEKEKETINEKGIWIKEQGRPCVAPPKGDTIAEAFLSRCDTMKNYCAAIDAISGRVTYRQIKLGAIILAKKLKEFPGKHIGIMLPASVAVNILILAVQLANKIPVMINWTLGPRNLNAVIDEAKVKVVLTSWAFLDKLDNVELGKVDEKIVLLEEIRGGISLFDKLEGMWLAFRKKRGLLSYFGLEKLDPKDPAVILFTSGTENLPKGVPLSHKNILENQRGAYQYVAIKDKDVLLGILPPFHSFGFSVTGLFPLLSGLRVAFSPNPTDGRRMAQAIRRWKVSIVCIAPTFLKNLLRAAKKTQLKTLRLVVAGAEKLPTDLYLKLKELNEKTRMVEGYGITECAPILTLSPPDGETSHGVGLPLPQVELKIVKPDDPKVDAKPHEAGLILARGPNVFAGYLNPKLPSPFVHIKGQLWYETGDLGLINDTGFLILAGRLKRFVKIGGEMVSLGAVEEVLQKASLKHGWQGEEEGPSLAVCAKEEEGRKAEMVLFTTFEASLEEVNAALKKEGMSNLIKISKLKKLRALPLLGTGKVDYRTLKGKV